MVDLETLTLFEKMPNAAKQVYSPMTLVRLPVYIQLHKVRSQLLSTALQ